MTLRHASLRRLQVFEAVARLQSFSRAAAELHLTQPAVSMQVQQLEEEVGLPPLAVEVVGYLDDYPTVTGYRVTPVVGIVAEMV